MHLNILFLLVASVAGLTMAAPSSSHSMRTPRLTDPRPVVVPPPPTTCELNGRNYLIGEQMLTNDPCEGCTCERDGHALCYHYQCGWPRCIDGAHPITKPGACCPSCPPPTPCVVQGRTYSYLERVPPRNPCDTFCYCGGRGQVICSTIQCSWPHCPDGEQPVFQPGDCCPSCPQPQQPY